MRTKTIKSIILAIIVALAIGSTALAEAALTIPQENFDFGIMPQNSKVTGGYWLVSSGSDTLKITDVKPGCGCTKAPLQKNIIAPGDSTFLEITFSSKQYTNRVYKTIRINSNTSEPSRTISLTGMVKVAMDSTNPVVIKPYILDVSQYGTRKRDHIYFNMENVTDKDLTWHMVHYPGEYFDIEFPHTIKAGETAKGTLTVKPEYVNGNFDQSFTIEFDNQGKTHFTIPVTRTVRHPEKPATGK